MNEIIYNILIGTGFASVLIVSCTATYCKYKIIHDYFNNKNKLQRPETEIVENDEGVI